MAATEEPQAYGLAHGAAAWVVVAKAVVGVAEVLSGKAVTAVVEQVAVAAVGAVVLGTGAVVKERAHWVAAVKVWAASWAWWSARAAE